MKQLIFLNSLTFIQESENASEIQGIIEPVPVPYSFDTLGWKIVGFLLLLIAIQLLLKAYKRYQQNAYRRNAISFLNSLEQDPENANFEMVSATLKKVALTTYGRDMVAALHGTSWLQFLQEKGKDTPFLKYQDQLTDVIYTSDKLKKTTSEELLRLSKKWIKTHA